MGEPAGSRLDSAKPAFVDLVAAAGGGLSVQLDDQAHYGVGCLRWVALSRAVHHRLQLAQREIAQSESCVVPCGPGVPVHCLDALSCSSVSGCCLCRCVGLQVDDGFPDLVGLALCVQVGFFEQFDGCPGFLPVVRVRGHVQ
ncbi:hypothetical protein AB0D57_24790 [Streptomyces sp. NPDC048275]|uniref:hypothetical protein n=1 Tax=Streptomyces sp. NPDC048275 TaxID=3155629 RepID=UPI0033C93135